MVAHLNTHPDIAQRAPALTLPWRRLYQRRRRPRDHRLRSDRLAIQAREAPAVADACRVVHVDEPAGRPLGQVRGGRGVRRRVLHETAPRSRGGPGSRDRSVGADDRTGPGPGAGASSRHRLRGGRRTEPQAACASRHRGRRLPAQLCARPGRAGRHVREHRALPASGWALRHRQPESRPGFSLGAVV